MLSGLTKIRITGTFIVAAALPLVLVSCGGGSGGGASTAPGVPALSTAVISKQPIPISDANYSSVAKKALFGINGGSNFQFPNMPTAADISTAPSNKSITTIVKNIFSKIEKSSTNSATVSGAVKNCPGGGSATIPDNLPGSGDLSGTYTISFNNCKDGSETINGSVTVSGKITRDLNGFTTSIKATITFNNLSYSNVNENTAIDGGFTITSSTIAGAETFSLQGSRLSIRTHEGALELTAFNISFESNTTEDIFNVNYTISSTFEINGSITVATPTPFKITKGMNYPYVGEMFITGDGSKLRLFVESGTGLPSDTVTIEVDTDGIPGYEVSKTLMWSEL